MKSILRGTERCRVSDTAVPDLTKGPETFRRLITVAIAVAALLALMLPVGTALAEDSSWKIGRGVVSGADSSFTLKISLRNTGAPTAERVRVMGRWTGERPGKKNISGAELSGFTELGSYAREVRMKQTVILDIDLSPLGPRPGAKDALEVAVITGREISDGEVIQVE